MRKREFWYSAPSVTVLRGMFLLRVNRCVTLHIDRVQNCQRMLTSDLASYITGSVGMSRSTLDEERQKAWLAAKQAVRAYAKEPSEMNAEKVGAAWQRVRRMRGTDHLRAMAQLAQSKSDRHGQST